MFMCSEKRFLYPAYCAAVLATATQLALLATDKLAREEEVRQTNINTSPLCILSAQF